MNEKSGTYMIKNHINGKVYYGSSNNLKTRKRQHFYMLKINKHENKILQRAYNKYGKESLEFIILNYYPVGELLSQEQILLDLNYDAGKKCYNHNKIATMPPSQKGKKHSEKTKKNMSKSHKGKKFSEEHRQKISAAKKGDKNPMYGKHHSKENKLKISQTHKGSKHHNYDHTIYTFIHENGTEENCTRYELIKKYNLGHGHLSKIIKNKRKSHKGWRIYK